MLAKRLAIVVIYALLCVLALSSSLRARKHGGLDKEKKQPRVITPEDVPIDAFNLDICGKMSASAVRPWHKQQAAFGCARGSRVDRDGGQSRVVGGEQALDGEFPAAVRLSLSGKRWLCSKRCGGILVHKDLVLTSASCLKPRGQHCRIATVEVLIAGTGKVWDTKKWCWHLPTWSPFPEHELAVVQLDKPLDSYTPGKNGPACLPRLDAAHSANATCAIAGKAKTNQWYPGTNTAESQMFTHLQTTTVKRDLCAGSNAATYETCYASKRGLGCAIDLGGPVMCYDRCSPAEPDSVRAFAVGVMSRWNHCGPRQDFTSTKDATTTHAIDLHLARDQLMELLEVMHKNKAGSESVICRNATEEFLAAEEQMRYRPKKRERA